ncbi:hypothetical protein TVAG_168480 [Trichomonas vaginalis G3]|uniref:Uncharacterized protein n=1 Tax=Trichomonas vaginalis (strain ATCC PRA-98 / G3) TaxID=412133 RepID=A2F2F1_TRIV3|nr:hypothetical protein TVAGG3_0253000 [Trichomonas vaginalis G3]EAY00917.1 hypothetical protein TVAG_168480 [Trichomonas vaginalis G3]KAI5554156.1 hypothetical protein TVAGG3_0253000 [Trichomonas vaginalis G3]|eukprot:XP_001313846.1 hypothetical protein [Trichomonas vaginalis G3]
MKLDLSANSGDKSVKFTVPIVDMKNVDLSDAAKQLLLDFTESELVKVDKDSFTKLTNSVFNNLQLLAKESVSQITLSADKYSIGNFEVLKDKVKGVLSLKDVVIPSGGLTLSASGTTDTNGFGFNFDTTGNLGTIKFDNTWNAVTKFGEGFSFTSEGDLSVERLPNAAPIKVGGSDTLSIKIEEGRPSLTISGNTEINAAGKTIKLTGNVGSSFSVSGENLVVGGSGIGSFKVTKEDGTELPVSFKTATFEKSASINVLQVIQNLTAKFGSYINISKLIFPATPSAKRVAQEDSSDKDITIGYKFTENGIPNLRINEVSGTPSNIYLVYNATDRETRDLVPSDWIDNPVPIISAKFSVQECNNWRKNIVSTFLTPSVESITLATSCEEGLDDDESVVTLTMSLKAIEVKPESNEVADNLTPTPANPDENNNDKIFGIPKTVFIGVVAGVCVVAVIAVVVGIVVCTKRSKTSKKSKKEHKKSKKSKKHSSSSSSFDESSD